MTDTQLYLAIGVPVIMNGVMFTMLATLMGARITSLETSINGTTDEIRSYYLGNTDGFQFGDADEHPAAHS